MPKKQTKKHNPNKQTKKKAKLRSGWGVSGMINIDEIIRRSLILQPFIANNSINHEYIDNFIKERLLVLINNLSITPKQQPLGLKLQELISNHIEHALKSDKINNAINEFINDKLKRLTYERK